MVKKKPVDAARARGESGAATGAAAPRLSRGASARKRSASSAAGVPQKKNAVPDVEQGKMTWSMHVPSQGDFHPSGTLTCAGDDVPLADVPDTAEYGLNQRDAALRVDAEESAVAAKTQDDLLLFSDTVATLVRQKMKARVRACAEQIEVCVPPYTLFCIHAFIALHCTHCKCAGVHSHVRARAHRLLCLLAGNL